MKQELRVKRDRAESYIAIYKLKKITFDLDDLIKSLEGEKEISECELCCVKFNVLTMSFSSRYLLSLEYKSNALRKNVLKFVIECREGLSIFCWFKLECEKLIQRQPQAIEQADHQENEEELIEFNIQSSKGLALW